MKIIEPAVECWEANDLGKHIVRCARVCYKKDKGNDELTYKNLFANHHWSMFRHATYYYIVPNIDVIASYNTNMLLWIAKLNEMINDVKQLVVGIDIKFYKDTYYIITNGNWNLDHQKLVDYLLDYQVEPKEFANSCEIAWRMIRYTFKITTQISTSRELNRVSPNNIAEQSTRYVYEDGTICRPHWLSKDNADRYNETQDDIQVKGILDFNYIRRCDEDFRYYKALISNNMPRQDARGVLPLDTATVCVYTYSVSEWKHIIDLRADKRAHPNAQIIANMVRDNLNEFGYEL